MLSPKVDAFLVDGCGRCNYYKTDDCKVRNWNDELIALRKIVQTTELVEDLKWSQPCYTFNDKNVLILSAFKDYAFLSFFKGSLMKDKAKCLVFPGDNSQASKQLRFTTADDIKKSESLILNYIEEAIALELSGEKVAFKKNPEALLAELIEKFDEDEAFKKAFEGLTPGRQRGYVLHFSQAKQASTRTARIEKYRDQILKGIGFHDVYKAKMKKPNSK